MKPTKRYVKVALSERGLKKSEIDESLKKSILEIGGYTLFSKVQYKLIEISENYAIIRFRFFGVDPAILFLILPFTKTRNSWLIPLTCSGALNNLQRT